MIIAIDGPAASGKGTLARRLAEHYGLPHLDTGLLYRATAAALFDQGRDLGDVHAAIAAARGLALTDFDDARLRAREMGEAASVVAALPAVREALVQAQRDFAQRPGGAVLDGRDIGTVICPASRCRNLRHREPRSPSAAAAPPSAPRAAKRRITRRSSPISPNAMRAIRSAPPRRFRPLPTLALPRHHKVRGRRGFCRGRADRGAPNGSSRCRRTTL